MYANLTQVQKYGVTGDILERKGKMYESLKKFDEFLKILSEMTYTFFLCT